VLQSRAASDPLRGEWMVVVGHKKRAMTVGATPEGLSIGVDGRTLKLDQIDWRPGLPTVRGRLDGKRFTVSVKPAAEGFQIRYRAASQHVLVLTARSAELHEKLPPKRAADTSKMVLSPMPGLVVSIDVATGQEVKTGEIVAVLEAMKMQNIIRAERDGTVKAVNAKAGDSVAADELLVEFA
jgi:propionyl-CoA carboxylase alpha chain